MQRDDDDLIPYDDDQLRAFAQLPRELPLAAGETDRMVRRLRDDGVLHPRTRVWRRAPLIAAAAIVVFALGVAAGAVAGRRGSLEDMLARTDLTVSDRILLLQRAGSAYVSAAQGYAGATQRADSTAVEVASRVLVGAANAVARHNLDAGMAARLSEALKQPAVFPAAQRKPLIWF